MAAPEAPATGTGTVRDPAHEVARGFPVTDRTSWLILVGVGLLVLAGLGWAVFGRAPNSVSGPGMVVPATGLQMVGQATAGTVTTVRVRPRDIVAAGQVLATVTDARGRVQDVVAPAMWPWPTRPARLPGWPTTSP